MEDFSPSLTEKAVIVQRAAPAKSFTISLGDEPFQRDRGRRSRQRAPITPVVPFRLQPEPQEGAARQEKEAARCPGFSCPGA